MKKIQKTMLDKLASISKFAAAKAAGAEEAEEFYNTEWQKSLEKWK